MPFESLYFNNPPHFIKKSHLLTSLVMLFIKLVVMRSVECVIHSLTHSHCSSLAGPNESVESLVEIFFWIVNEMTFLRIFSLITKSCRTLALQKNHFKTLASKRYIKWFLPHMFAFLFPDWRGKNEKETPCELVRTHLWVNRFFWTNTENDCKRGDLFWCILRAIK